MDERESRLRKEAAELSATVPSGPEEAMERVRRIMSIEDEIEAIRSQPGPEDEIAAIEAEIASCEASSDPRASMKASVLRMRRDHLLSMLREDSPEESLEERVARLEERLDAMEGLLSRIRDAMEPIDRDKYQASR